MKRSAPTEQPPKKAAKKTAEEPKKSFMELYGPKKAAPSKAAPSKAAPSKATSKVSKQSRPEHPPVACVISGLCAENKLTVARCLLQELEVSRVVLLAPDAAVAKQALPGSKVRQFAGLSKSAGTLAKSLAMSLAASASLATASFAELDVLRAAFAETPAALKTLAAGSFASFLPPNVVAISHELARPAKVAAALAGGAGTVRLVTVVDATTFLDDWEEGARLEKALMKASPKESRKVSDVLAELIESADVVVLATPKEEGGGGGEEGGEIDDDELSMMEAMLRELNPSATVLRRGQGGAGGGGADPLLPRLLEAEVEGLPALEARAGWRRAVEEARAKEEEAGEEMEREVEEAEEGEEEEEEEDDDDDDEEEEEDEEEEGEEGEEGEEEEEEGEEDDEEDEEEGEEADEGEEGWQPPVLSRFAYLARRPFHPARLRKLLSSGCIEGVIRSCGVVWIASHQEARVEWRQAGNAVTLLPGKPWLDATYPSADKWPTDAAAPAWARTARHGDRRQELGLVGMDADEAAVRRVLDRALVTRKELALGPAAWARWEDKVTPVRKEQTAEALEKRKKRLRFGVGDSVECKTGKREWTAGVVVALMFHDAETMPEGKVAPYQIELDNGELVYAPTDKDAVIRKAAA